MLFSPEKSDLYLHVPLFNFQSFPHPFQFLAMMPLVTTIMHYSYVRDPVVILSLSIPYQRHAVSATDRAFSITLIEGTSDSVLVGLSTVPLSTLLCGCHWHIGMEKEKTDLLWLV